MNRRVESVLEYKICKELITYFLRLLNQKESSDRTSSLKLGLNPNAKSKKKCFDSLYCPEYLKGEIEAEKHLLELEALGIILIEYRDKKHTFPLYKRKAMIYFKDEFENECRKLLKMELSNLSKEWSDAIEETLLSLDKKEKLKSLTPIEYKNKTSKEIVSKIEEYLMLKRENDFIREASAFIFWGHSKMLDSKVDYWDFLKVIQKPIQIIAYVPSIECRDILFIENEQTFESLKRKPYIADKYILIFLSGFMGTASRLTNKEYRSFYKDSKKGIVKGNFLNSIFDNQNEFNYLFWGDLDYEGVNIYLALKKTFPKVRSWKYAYDIMIKQLLKANGHDAVAAEKEKQKKPNFTGDEYIDNILIPNMDQYGFFDQEGVLL